jgi:predicted nucleic acid-binding protein
MKGRLHLDTNALIALSDPSQAMFGIIEHHLREGWSVGTDAVAWHEYVRGPLLAEDRERVLLIIDQKVIPLTREISERAAFLFNHSGRRRGSTSDCLIAAACMFENAELVTENWEDFHPFVPHGLRFASRPPSLA